MASTASPNVIVKVLGRDDVSAVTEVRLSNDGSTWAATVPYTAQESEAQAIDWNLIDPAYGGTDSDGTKTVFAEFRDASGKWSEPETDTIVLDRSGNSSPYSNAVLSDGPSGYWRLGEAGGTTASDAAGANPGTYDNGPALGQPSLLPADAANKAVGFDGSDDYIDIQSSGPLTPSTAVSVEAWIKPAALPGAAEFASIASKPGSYSLQLNGSRLEFKIDQPGGSGRLQAPLGAIQVGHAYYVVGTFDGTTQRLYIGGLEVAEAARPAEPISTSGDELRIGSWNGSEEFFNGAIDEVAVYTAALSAARIDAHYQAAIGGAPPDTTVDAPSELTATAVSDRQIDLHWIDNSDNEGEFRIERDTSPAFASPVVEATWANSTTFSEVGLSPGTTYYCRVRARNATESSGYSNTATATTPTSAPDGTASPPAFPPSPLISPSSPKGYAAVVTDDRPVSYWRLDELSGRRARDARDSNPGFYVNDPQLGGSESSVDRSGRSLGPVRRRRRLRHGPWLPVAFAARSRLRRGLDQAREAAGSWRLRAHRRPDELLFDPARWAPPRVHDRPGAGSQPPSCTRRADRPRARLSRGRHLRRDNPAPLRRRRQRSERTSVRFARPPHESVRHRLRRRVRWMVQRNHRRGRHLRQGAGPGSGPVPLSCWRAASTQDADPAKSSFSGTRSSALSLPGGQASQLPRELR